MSSLVLQAKGIHKVYQRGPSTLDILQNLDLDIYSGKTIAIMGESGVGKSTLLQILGGLLRPTSGEVFFEGRSIFQSSESEIAKFRNRSIGFIFQFHYLLPEFSALENVMMPSRICGRAEKEQLDYAHKLLGEVGLSNRMAHRPSELSGGEQQRVAIVRALMNRPKVVLADEPTGNLDVETADEVSDLLMRMVKDNEMALVIATHSSVLASRADRILRLRMGRLHEANI